MAKVLNLARTAVGSHDDDGVAEIHRSAVAVRETSLIGDLQEDVEDILVRLLNLIEEHDGVGFTANPFRELSALIVAHVARRSTHHAAHRMLFHILAHVDADESLLGAEEFLGQFLGQVGLAHTRGAHEEEGADGLLGVFESDPAALDGLGNLRDGIILSDDRSLQCGSQ